MKKTILAALVVCTAAAALGQGTVQFSNGPLSKISIYNGQPISVLTTPGLINYGLFYGMGQSTSLTFLSSQLGVNSTTGAGLIANPIDGTSVMNEVGIPGTLQGETDVWLQVKAWSASFGTDYNAAYAAFLNFVPGAHWGQSTVANIIGFNGLGLGSPSGPGAPIWQSSTGTNPNLLHPFIIDDIPEPGALAWAGLVTAMVMIRLRRR